MFVVHLSLHVACYAKQDFLHRPMCHSHSLDIIPIPMHTSNLLHVQLTVTPQWSMPNQLVVPVEVKIGTHDSSCAATVVTSSDTWDAASELHDGNNVRRTSLCIMPPQRSESSVRLRIDTLHG